MSNRHKCWMIRSAALGLFCMGFCSSAFGQQPLSDPTRPVVISDSVMGARSAMPVQWKLTSTLIAPQRRVAVINDQVLTVGQKIDGARLVAVMPGSALLHHAGKTIQLKLISGTVKHAVAPVP